MNSDTDTLRKQTLASVLRFQIALALMLFVPAWTLDFWQAWLYWAAFGAALLGLARYFVKHDPGLARRRLHVGARAETLRSQQIIQSIAGLGVVAIYVVAGFERHFAAVSPAPSISIAADLVVLAGLWIMFEVFRENSYAASTVKVEPDQRVVATGPYALVRHPMYSASVLIFLATPLALGSRWAMIPAALVSIMIVVRLLDEERLLARELPGYAAYCRRVRWRLVPRVW